MVRVRFAPSPTGELHVGGLRTALFNYLFAKKENGKFILRMEDTDLQRSKKEFENSIMEDLKWAGIEWDEGPDVGGEYGPYRQSERFEIYRKFAKLLIDEKKAYYAVYSKDNPEKIIFSTFEFPEKYAKDSDYLITINFKVPKDGYTEFNDLAKGKIKFQNQLIDDFIIIRSNGIPVYNFAVVIDDHLMKITHVFRGEDHISNTHKQILLYEAFGWKMPNFMHIPLILGNDRTPLSKRHGGTTVKYFRSEGILKNALINYLALLGWKIEDGKEIFNVYEKIPEFSINRISNKSVVFDYKKLRWVCGNHLRSMDIDQVFDEFVEFLKFIKSEFVGIILSDTNYSKNVLLICREKVNTLKELLDFSKPFFVENFEYEEKYLKEYLYKDFAKGILEAALNEIQNMGSWEIEEIGNTLRKISEKTNVGRKKVFQSIRGAVLGKLITPGLFESIWVLGKKRTLERIERALLKIREEFSKT